MPRPTVVDALSQGSKRGPLVLAPLWGSASPVRKKQRSVDVHYATSPFVGGNENMGRSTSQLTTPAANPQIIGVEMTAVEDVPRDPLPYCL